jgi:hypothetical protein
MKPWILAVGSRKGAKALVRAKAQRFRKGAKALVRAKAQRFRKGAKGVIGLPGRAQSCDTSISA